MNITVGDTGRCVREEVSYGRNRHKANTLARIGLEAA
jgi:hypothetical protein